MGIMALVAGLCIFGCLGFLIVQHSNHSAPSSSAAPRRRSRR